MPRALAIVGLLVSITAATGCASARMGDNEADNLFRAGKYDEAAEHIKKGLAKEGENGRDLLLYLLDLGLAQHSAGKLDEAIRTFARADKIAEIKDYTSIAAEGATLLTSDQLKDYKAEDFENVLISTYLAIDYALKGATEDALVEARRINRKLILLVQEGGRKYKQSAFGRYLSAMLYESVGNWNDAYIDYKTAYDLEPNYPGIGRDLWRTAMLSKLTDKAEEWEKTLDIKADDKKAAMATAPKRRGRGNEDRGGKSEIIVIYENGISPVKKPNPSFYQVPKFFARSNPVSAANVEVVGQGETQAPAQAAQTASLMSIEAIAMQNLDEKYGGIVAKKLAGVVAKEAAGAAITKLTGNQMFGDLAKLAMYASDQADTRSWNLLPRDLEVVRFAVEPGTYVVKATPIGAGALPDKTVQAGPGKKIFVAFRYMP